MKTEFEVGVYGRKLLHNETHGRGSTYENLILKYMHENSEYRCRINLLALPSRAEWQLT
jgi:hypothetical protein